MNTRAIACVVVVTAAAAALAYTTHLPPPAENSVSTELFAQAPTADADRAAIRKSSQAFEAAFNKADAKSIAAMWTENAEIHETGGELIRGRANIEKAFADYFKENPNVKVEVVVEAIRFPAADLAVEEGILRQVRPGKELPSTTLYSVTHIREGGKWLMAISNETGAGQDRLEDLDWLIGDWKASTNGAEVTLSFARDGKKPFIMGKFTRTDNKKETTSGTFRIALDREMGRLRSWHFDDDGGHGEATWVRDGNRWVLDSIGVLGDGTPTAGLNIIGRVDGNTITWRSIDRVLGGKPLPDTIPQRLTRTPAVIK